MNTVTIAMFASLTVAVLGAIRGSFDPDTQAGTIKLIDVIVAIARHFAMPLAAATAPGYTPAGPTVLISSLPEGDDPAALNAWAETGPVVRAA